jgi:hypothetical protein
MFVSNNLQKIKLANDAHLHLLVKPFSKLLEPFFILWNFNLRSLKNNDQNTAVLFIAAYICEYKRYKEGAEEM